MSDVLELLSEETFTRLSEVYHDLGSRLLLIYQDIYEKYGLVMRVTCGYRSIEEQNLLYAKGRSMPGKIVTNAQGGESWHNFGLAIDSCFEGPDPYLEKNEKSQEIWEFFGKKCGDTQLIWGGHFLKIIDKPHAEKRYGQTLQSCKTLVDSVEIAGLWKQLDANLQSIYNKENLH